MEFQISEPFVPKGASPKKRLAKRALKDVKHFFAPKFKPTPASFGYWSLKCSISCSI